MTSLLDSKVHTVLLTWLLTQQVTGLTRLSNLDMAPNAFDDQYEGCVKEMERKAPQLLQEDFTMNGKLKLEWEKAEQRWKEIKNTINYPKGFHDFHGIALVAYTGYIHQDFNRAVREFKKNPGNFHYKAFHYYLTRALQLLSNQNCHSVYRGTKSKFHFKGKDSVRFGQFASSTSARQVAVSQSFLSEHGTLFTIKTCLGVDIKAFSVFPREEEVLIPGYEVYHKVTVTQNGKGYDKISLDSPERKKSYFNCYYSGSIETDSGSIEADSGFIEIDNIDCSSSGFIYHPSILRREDVIHLTSGKHPSRAVHSVAVFELEDDIKILMFLLTWLLTQQITGLTDTTNLDMAPNAFDDQYEGCVKKMERKAPQLLQEDFIMNGQLKLEWEKAEQRWKEIKNTINYPKGFHDFHGIALVAYTGNIYQDFNRAVREFKKNPGNFHYKAFHYYLTRALQLLRNNNCYSVYRGTSNKFYYGGDGSVRFGQFTSSSLKENVALSTFGGLRGTLFTIKTCLGVNIKEFSYHSEQEEVLIPGYEVYHKVTQTAFAIWFNKIVLDSPERKRSNFNCFYSGSTDTSHFSSSERKKSYFNCYYSGSIETDSGSIEADSGFIEIDNIDCSSSAVFELEDDIKNSHVPPDLVVNPAGMASYFKNKVTGLTEPSNLDMAPNAFDDQYEGCVEEMERKAPQLLQEDFNISTLLKPEWEKAEQRWKKIKNTMSYPKGFHDFHGIALVAYTGKIYQDFNRAVREFKNNPSNFHYKAFHYYLTRALQLLGNNKCHLVYRGTSNKFRYSKDGSVRFGQFTSSSLKEREARSFSGSSGTLFIIKTCFGVNITAFSYKPNQEEVLIPGYEVYKKVTEKASGEGYDKIELDSPERKRSNFNCYYSGSTDTSHFSSSGESGSVLEVGLVGKIGNGLGGVPYQKTPDRACTW
ncbi:hypothetical protein STEG23_036680 [Scotinomys teguina]